MKDRKDIVTGEPFYLTDGGRVHFYYDEEDDGYYLCGGLWTQVYQGYNGCDATELYIPNTINGKPVLGLDADLFDRMVHLSSFVVEDDHPSFRLWQGGLYSKDGKQLIRMPLQYRQKVFRVPDSVECIMDSALCNPFIETLILSHQCQTIREYGVPCAKNLKAIYLPRSLQSIGFKAFVFTSPKDVFYEGDEEDREKIEWADTGFNVGLIKAQWHYQWEWPKE